MPRRIVAKVYEADGVTHVRDLTSDRGRRWLDDLAPGTGVFSIDTALDHDDAAALTFGRIVRFFVDGVARWQGIIEPATQTSAAPGRRSARTLAATGRGVLAAWEFAELYPELGVGSVTPQNRFFGPASLDYVPGAYGPDWVPAVELKQQDDPSPPWVLEDGSTAPQAWQDNTAKWIGAADDDTPPTGASVRHFRRAFTVGEEIAGEFRFFMTADDGFVPYLDGDRRGGEARAGLWGETRYFDALLDAGDHVLYVRAVNFERPDPDLNVFGFLCSVMKMADGGASYPLVLFHSDDDWEMLADPAAEPGMTPGQIVEIFYTEAQSRGALDGWSLGFDGDVDSDGAPWSDAINVSMPVGTNGLDFLAKLTAEGVVEFAVDAATLTLHAYLPLRGDDVHEDVALVLGPDPDANLGELGHQRLPPGRNVALARTGDGRYVEVVDTDAVTAYGRREGFLSLGGAPDFDAGIRQGIAWVHGQKDPDEAISNAQVEVVPGGPAPWVDYNVADLVTAPAMDGSAAIYRIRSLAVEEDDAGQPIFKPELGNRLRRGALESIGRTLAAMNPGGAAGSFDAVSPTSGLEELKTHPAYNFVGDEDAIINTDGLWSDAFEVSGPWPADLDGFAYQVMVTMETVASDDLVFGVLIGGSATEEFTVPAGEGTVAEAWVGDFVDEAAVAAGDGIQIEKVSGGTGADRVTIKVRMRSTSSVRGPVGPPGTDGNTILSGDVPPTEDDGVNGDYWIDTETWTIYGPKTGGTWPPGVDLGLGTIPGQRVTADYEIVLADVGTSIEVDDAAAVEVTIPDDATTNFPVGSWVELLRYGTGAAGFLQGDGVVFRSRNDWRFASDRYGRLRARKIDADEWEITGDLGDAPFSPADVAGLAGWWKADAITGLVDTDPVAQWDDESGNARHGTQATGGNKPTYRTNILNGLPVVRFDGGDFLDLAAFTLGTKAAVFAVVILRNTSGAQFIYEQSSDTDQRVFFWKQSGGDLVFGYHDGGAFRDYTKTWAPTVDVAYIVDGGTGAANNVVGISGAADSTPARTGYPTSASRAAQIGRSPGTGSPFNGDIAELIIYADDLDPADRDAIRDYLSAKWDVAL